MSSIAKVILRNNSDSVSKTLSLECTAVPHFSVYFQIRTAGKKQFWCETVWLTQKI